MDQARKGKKKAKTDKKDKKKSDKKKTKKTKGASIFFVCEVIHACRRQDCYA